MINLTTSNIRLNVTAETKEAAIRAVGAALIESGLIEPGYVESLFGREAQTNTYLGSGIAIPHGMQKDRELIRKTGIAVVQIPKGVEWNDGQTAHLIVGIAAKTDEHIAVLSALTDVLDDPAAAKRLATVEDAQEIVNALTRGGAADREVAPELDGGQEVVVRIVGEAGLHARPATMFSELANGFASKIQVRHGDKAADGKSMAALLRLGVSGGEEIRISAAGADASEVLARLKEAVESGLGEEESEEVRIDSPAWTPVSDGHVIAGVSACPGVAIGKIWQYRVTQIVVKDEPKDVATEEAALNQAVAAASAQIQAIYEDVTAHSGKNEAAIFRAHLALLSDSELTMEVLTRIDAGHSAAWSWQLAIERRVEELKGLENARLAERAVDLHDVGQRVLRLLSGSESTPAMDPDEPVILIAEDLTPSDTARLDPKRILGLCTAAGGPTSHTAIIARSLDIPALVGAGEAVLQLPPGRECIVDGGAGRIYVDPSAEDLESARAFQVELAGRRGEEYETRYQPAILTDGHRVEVAANIGKAPEAAAAVEAGAEGVGLMRTEFLFLDRETAPSEEEQYEAYCEMGRALNGLPMVVRTLDIGGDKVAAYLTMPKEENPFLGVRGIRLCLRQPEIFLPQLRAIYRASKEFPMRIMFPMISTLEDLRAAKELAEEVRVEVGAEPVEIGIMVEVPSTVLMAAEFAKEVDFFSIGTNDLTQYTLAMDRLHASLARNVDGLHPAVLRMVDLTVKAAKAEGKWVGVCGGVAGDPIGAAILTGLGVSELSVSLPSIAATKATLRRMSFAQTQALARKALACGSATEVRSLSL